MALEILFSDVIADRKIISRHPEAEYLRCRRGKCFQFNQDGFSRSIKIPKRTNYIQFQEYDVHGELGKHVTHIEYGKVVFYDHNDNILKVEETR